MGINSLSNSLTGMSEYTFDRRIVGTGIVYHGSAGVAAFVWRMLAAAGCHYSIKACSVLMICKLIAVIVCVEC